MTAENGETMEKPSLSVTIFSKNDCAICDRTKKHFRMKGIPFVEINVEEDRTPRDEFGGRTPFDYVVETYGRSMPVVVVTDDLGWDDWWFGGRMDKWRETEDRFRDAGLLIPESSRLAA